MPFGEVPVAYPAGCFADMGALRILFFKVQNKSKRVPNTTQMEPKENKRMPNDAKVVPKSSLGAFEILVAYVDVSLFL